MTDVPSFDHGSGDQGRVPFDVLTGGTPALFAERYYTSEWTGNPRPPISPEQAADEARIPMPPERTPLSTGHMSKFIFDITHAGREAGLPNNVTKRAQTKLLEAKTPVSHRRGLDSVAVVQWGHQGIGETQVFSWQIGREATPQDQNKLQVLGNIGLSLASYHNDRDLKEDADGFAAVMNGLHKLARRQGVTMAGAVPLNLLPPRWEPTAFTAAGASMLKAFHDVAYGRELATVRDMVIPAAVVLAAIAQTTRRRSSEPSYSRAVITTFARPAPTRTTK